MADPDPSDPVVYQLRVVLREVSPLIWRRLLVRADSSVADLHDTLQVAFGWGGEHLHRCVIHGCEYGISYVGGGFRHDARAVPLGSFGFRVGERFVYEYDFFAAWLHDLRVEAIMPMEPHRAYPRCVGGRRAGPPEGCGGAFAFLEQRQHYWPIRAPARVAEIFGEFLDDPESRLSEHREELAELAELLPWLTLGRFDRRAVNRRLAQLNQRRTA